MNKNTDNNKRAYSTVGINDSIWNSEIFREEWKLFWRYLIGIIAFFAGVVSPQTDNTMMNYTLSFITTSFLLIVINSQRSLSKFNNKKWAKCVTFWNVMILKLSVQSLVVGLFIFICIAVYLVVTYVTLKSLPEIEDLTLKVIINLGMIVTFCIFAWKSWNAHNVSKVLCIIEDISYLVFNPTAPEKLQTDGEKVIKLIYFEVMVVLLGSAYVYISTLVLTNLVGIIPKLAQLFQELLTIG
ncbi:hypothetical protein ACROAE_20150 [Shewanella sp. MF05960]|uniref:hypothetical protein n=1 Tax=Shewanella sp. MF05960 TaxID=3434874 RepID=UPI003D797545